MAQIREEFERAYAARSGVTVEELHAQGLGAVRCVDCDYAGCQGWVMGDLDEAGAEAEAGKGGETCERS